MCVELNGKLVLSVVVNGDVLLCAIYENVELEAVLSCLNVYVNCLICLIGSNKVSAINLTGDVESLAKVCLNKEELVCGVCLNVGYRLGNVNIGSCCINLNGEFLGYGLSALTSDSCGKSKLNLLFTKNYSKLAILTDGVCFVIDSPCNSNLVVVLTNKRKCDGSILGYISRNREIISFCSDLLCGSLLYELEVLEAIGAHRNEVRTAVVENKNTGCVSSPAELSCVCLVNGLLICAGNVTLLILGKSEGGGEVGNVGSYVSGLLANGEVEVLGSILLKLLCADGNTLNGYRKTYVVLKSSFVAILNCIGNVLNINGLDSLIDDSSRTAAELLHAGVRLNSRGNGNGHTNLDAVILNRILGKRIYVVTALTGSVCKEEVVVFVVCCLGVDSNNDTLNGNGVALFSCHIFLEGNNLVLRNVAVEGNSALGAVACYNGSGKLVVVCFRCLVVNVNSPRGLTLNELNLVVVNGPFNNVLNTCYHNLTNYLVVGSGDNCTGLGCRVALDVESSYVLYSCVNIIGNRLGVFFGFILIDKVADNGNLANKVGNLVANFLKSGNLVNKVINLVANFLESGNLVTSYHYGKREKENEN